METKEIYTVWESDSNGRDYPTFYEGLNKAHNHFEESKKEKPQYASIRKSTVSGWNTDDMDIIEEDNIESYYSEDEKKECIADFDTLWENFKNNIAKSFG